MPWIEHVLLVARVAFCNYQAHDEREEEGLHVGLSDLDPTKPHSTEYTVLLEVTRHLDRLFISKIIGRLL
jgi:hypothetical protein